MMRSILSFALATFLLLSSAIGLAAPAWASVPPQSIAALPLVGSLFAGTPPENLGVREGQLAPCQPSPNCVTSQNADPDHAIAPIEYHQSTDEARELLLKVLAVVPRTTVVEQRDRYIRVESESRLMGFVDDGEFYFPANESVIQIRSAARLGESDLGVNRRRLEQIRLALQDLGI